MMPARVPLPTIILIICVATSCNAVASDDAPTWLREVSTRQVPAYEAKVPAAVLLDEAHATVDEAGKIVTFRRRALKILSLAGRNHAYASQVYVLGSGKVREMRAWVISPSGEVSKVGKESEYDRAYVTGDLYNDIRERGVNAGKKADPGWVFGYESTIEERPLFTQLVWHFQSNLPVLASRYILTLAPGGHAQGHIYNKFDVAPVVDGSTYTWEVRNLPFIDAEPLSPHLDSLAVTLAVSYYPAAAAKAQSPLSFATWSAVSQWLSPLNDSPAVPDPAITAKAREITANARSDFEKIRAIGNVVRHMKYVSIQTGMARGGGYRPRLASDIFKTDYGDCKDKAVLMRALLSAVSLPSYAMFVSANDRTHVHEEWPSPEQFNHAIVAVRVGADVSAPAVLEDKLLGRLLIVDPTNSVTPVGELPIAEQGGFGLVGAGETGALVRLPMAPPEANLTTREIRAEVTDLGELKASVHESAKGRTAASDRQVYYSRPRPEFDKVIERWVSTYATAAEVSNIEFADSDDSLTLNFNFAARGYGQLKAGRLMVFKPVLLGRRETVFLTEPKRSYPVLLNPSSFREDIRIKVPSGFRPDELPDPVKLQSPFGEYSAKCQAANGELICSRTMETRAGIVPPEQYQAVREFYQKILAEEKSVVVLERQ
jgi:hypothetical protein